MTKLLVAVLLLLMSCTQEPQNQSAASDAASPPAGGALPAALATPGDEAPVPDQERQQPLRALGPCENMPNQGADSAVEGLVLPDDAVVTRVTPADPLTNVQGYVPMTPVQVRAFYQQHPDLTVISVEDEVHESEVLVETDGYRVFVKSQAVCELGSLFVAIVSPATAS